MRSERPIFSSSSTIRMRLDGIVYHGQQHTKSRAAQFSFHQYDVAAAQQGALAGDREAESHSAFLEGNGGLEEAGSRLLAQPRSGIVHLDGDPPVLRCRDPQNSAAFARRLRRV